MSWWSLHHFWKLLVLASWTSQWDSWESILSRLRQKLHLTNHPQHGNLTHYYYHYSPESLSPPRAVQLDDMQQPHCAWCGMWGWAFAEIPAFSIAFAELPRLFQLDQCWFDNPTLLKYLLPMHSESHNRSHMNWDVWNVWNPICMMIRWLLTLWWSTGKCACSINRSIAKQTQSKISEQLTSLSPNQNYERKKDSLSYPPKNQHLTYI